MLIEFARRTLAHTVAAARCRDLAVLSMRAREIVHGLRGVSGRTVEPITAAPATPYAPSVSSSISASLLDHRYSAEFETALDQFLTQRGGTDRWHTLHGNGPRSRMAGFEQGTLAELVHHTGPLAGKRVLDFGCGSGTITPSLAKRAAEVVGFDISPDAVALTRLRLAEHGLQSVSVHQAPSYREVADELGQFDLVLMHAVFEHVPLSVPNLRAGVLNLALDAVRPGGHLVISESPNRLWPKDIYCTGLWLLPWTKGGSRWSYRRAMRAGRHTDPAARGPITLEERGAWGFTYRAVRRYLHGRRYVVVNAQPGHDRWVRYFRSLGRARRMYETVLHLTVTRGLGIPVVAFAPMISPLVIQRIDGDARR